MSLKNPNLKNSKLLIYNELLKREFKIDFIENKPKFFFIKHNNSVKILNGVNNSLNTQIINLLLTDKVQTKFAIKEYSDFSTPDFIYFYKSKKKVNKKIIQNQIIEFLNKNTIIIAKPINGARSKLTFKNIDNSKDAFNAYNEIMKSKFSGVIFEKMLVGDVYRLLVIDGNIISVLKREDGFILGDGKNNISDLIKIKNRLKKSSKRTFEKVNLNSDLILTLKKQNLDLSTVPEINKKISISNLSNSFETVTEVFKSVHKTTLNRIEKFSKLLGIGLNGVDLISTDLGIKNNFSIIEMNSSPSIDFHHFPDFGLKKDVAKKIIDAILK